MYDLELSRRLFIIKSSRATSRVKWLNDENTEVSRTITVLDLRVLLKYPEKILLNNNMPDKKTQRHDEGLVLLLRISGHPETGYLDPGFSWFSSVPLPECRDNT
jgi:hypothetical protein